MKTLTIFHDPECGLCTRFHQWLEGQASYVPLEFISCRSELAKARFPQITNRHAERDLVVLADDGRFWQGPSAWLTCLWALREYREWSFRLATPALLPFIKKVCFLLSQNRFAISQLLRLKPDDLIAATLGVQNPDDCDTPAP